MAKIPRDGLVQAMRSSFVVPYEVHSEELPELKSPYLDIGLAFRQNLSSVMTVVSMPFALASSSVHRAHYQRISTAELIRAGARASDTSPENIAIRNAARERSATLMQAFAQSSEGQEQLGDDISAFLLSSMQEEPLAEGSSELLRQCIASAWTAFEVLARDLFIAYLNATPVEVLKLLQSPSTKKRFDAAKVPLADLAEHGFNLSSGMGTYLAKQQDMSDFVTIKATFEALFDTPELFGNEQDVRAMLLFNAQRHVIVHRRGLIDERYRALSGGLESVGSPLAVNPKEFENSLDICRRTGSRLLELFR